MTDLKLTENGNKENKNKGTTPNSRPVNKIYIVKIDIIVGYTK